MGHAIDEKPFPRGILLAGAALLMFSVAAAGTARITGLGVSRPLNSPVIEQHLLSFTKEADGTITVRDAKSGETTAVVPAKNFGFVGVVLQGVAHERRMAQAPADAPLLLSWHEDGRARIEDPETGQRVMLGAFGPGNHAAFAKLFGKGRTTP